MNVSNPDFSNNSMKPDKRLGRSFFGRPVLDVAQNLLGAILVHKIQDQRIGGYIIETEAYRGEEDLACHARSGKTDRTRIMYGPPGFAYVYFNYGIHWLFNCVTDEEDYPSAVLIRAIQPSEGLTFIQKQRRGIEPSKWCDGPAKLTKSLAIDGRHNGLDLCHPDSEIWFEKGMHISKTHIQTSPRIGIQRVPEPWRSKPWRFTIPGNIIPENLSNL